MATSTQKFGLTVDQAAGLCPTGEAYAERNIAEKKTPVLSCEGGCIRGEIARLAANLVAREVPGHARACHAEAFLVPDSAMARWVKDADQTVMIDGCFLRCHGRVLDNLVDPARVMHIDANTIHQKYGDVFAYEDIPEDERRSTARQVADAIIERIGSSTESAATHQ
jgi:uncharacterized metal-binding protein